MKFKPGVWPFYSQACRRDVNALLKKGGSLSAYRANKKFGLGPSPGSWADRLEREIESRFKVKHAVAVNSGTAALHAALHSLDLRGGDVITSPYSFSATVSSILLAGGVPVFADVDPYTSCITKETVSRVITKRTKAILPVHLFGGVAQQTLALKDFNVPVIEDACQAVGANCKGVFSGSFGIAGAYSFNGGKNIPAGESGALVTNSPEVAERARLLGNHGENFGSKEVGYNFRINEVTACIAWHGLQELEERNKERRRLASYVTHLSKGLGAGWEAVKGPYFRVPRGVFAGDHVFYVYPFTVHRTDRAAFCKRLRKRGVTCGEGYIQPTLNRYPAFRKYQRCPLPVVEELSSKTLVILDQVRPPATKEDMLYIAESIKWALK